MKAKKTKESPTFLALLWHMFLMEEDWPKHGQPKGLMAGQQGAKEDYLFSPNCII